MKQIEKALWKLDDDMADILAAVASEFEGGAEDFEYGTYEETREALDSKMETLNQLWRKYQALDETRKMLESMEG